MINMVEDCRINNFVAESYPKFKEQMRLAYEQNLDSEAKAKTDAEKKLGEIPRLCRLGLNL